MIDLLLGRKKDPPSLKKTGASAILLQLDAGISERHSYKNRVTKYPVEKGLDVTDHIRQEPESFVLEGIVSNSPIAQIPFLSDYKAIVNQGKDRVMSAYEALLLIMGRKMVKVPTMTAADVNMTIPSKPLLVDISANLRVFNDMVFEELEFDFDAKTGDSLPFKATACRIVKVSTSKTTINFVSTSAGGAAGTDDQVDQDDKGTQETKPKKISSWMYGAGEMVGILK
ncbi:MAG TPA: hypothetical protein VKF42_12230 [Chitinivibrionales bacterium]|nr:hypothetical protein [Chitinivibrionales bacterium]